MSLCMCHQLAPWIIYLERFNSDKWLLYINKFFVAVCWQKREILQWPVHTLAGYIIRPEMNKCVHFFESLILSNELYISVKRIKPW